MSERHPDWEIGDIEYDPANGIGLAAATIWPDDHPLRRETPDGREYWVSAITPNMAYRIEAEANRRLGSEWCVGDHLEELPCPDCGAAI